MSFTLGQEVYLVRHYMRGEPVRLVKVTKVGRKYVYVEGGKTPYNPETGAEVSEYSHHSSIMSKEARASRQREIEATKTLNDFGVRLDDGSAMMALDLFCCAGGASDGLVRAGFQVHGVDLEPQPEYPHGMTVRDALAYPLDGWDFVWASPPCQFATAYRRRPEHVKPALNLIPQTRELLIASGLPYVIENVVGAREHLRNPVMLCGSMFGLDVQRHRLFECSFPVTAPPCRHDVWTPKYPGATNRAKNSRKTVEVGVYRIPLETQRKAMGVDRPVSLHKLSQMVPPAYAEWLGLQARAHILTRRRAA